MKATFENSVNVLVKAYFNDTLEECDCTRCAVGNLIRDAFGLKCDKDFYVLPYSNERSGSWYSAIHQTPFNLQHPHIAQNGYTVEHLLTIERTFMRTRDDFTSGGFEGLLAVVDVLAEIHGVDLTAKESAIGQFQKVKSEKVPA